MRVTIRPLKLEDANISYKWRNNPEIWKYTGNRPDKEISLEMEIDWFKKVSLRNTEKRFAICVGEIEEYVGNIQLTEINENSAQFHIFIGNEKYHNLGIGSKASVQIIKYGFEILKLKEIYLHVKVENLPAIKSYKKCGFETLKNEYGVILMHVENV